MNELPRKAFGNSRETCTGLGLGGAWPATASFDRAVETVRRAVDLGIDTFDTSVMYRKGSSQAIMGEAREGRPQRHFLATKIGYFRQPSHFRSVAAMRVQLEENLRLLRR